jgi:hypothetical protein
MAYLDDLLGEDESVRIIAHRHILFLVLHTTLYVIGAVVLWALAIVAWQVAPRFERLIALVLLVVSLVPLAIAIYRFLVWKLEQYIVTNYRILQVEGILNKRTFDSSLNKVNDVLMTQSVFGRLFGYGNIEIITGSEIGVNKLTGIADPFTFKRGLLDAKMDIDGFDTPRRFAGNGGDNSRLLAALAELRDSEVISVDEYNQRKRQLP